MRLLPVGRRPSLAGHGTSFASSAACLTTAHPRVHDASEERSMHVPLLARVADSLSDFGPSWAFCGGWTVDLWLGRETRDHCDVDLSIFHDDQLAIFEYFTDGWLLNGHDVHNEDGTEPWDGRLLEF